MGNLEKAGVLVVVALLAVILVVAFLNFPDQHQTTMLASVGKQAAVDPKKPAKPKTEPANIPADPPSDMIRPKPIDDRSSDTPAPVLVGDPSNNPPPAPVITKPVHDDIVVRPTPTNAPKPEPPADAKKPSSAPASAYPKVVKVQAGQSLWAIAVKEYGAKVGPHMLGAIADANPKVKPEALKPGTELTMPAPPEAGSAVTKAPGEAAPKTTPGGSATTPKEPAATPVKTGRKLPFVPE